MIESCEITYLEAPFAGGPIPKELTSEQKEKDSYARTILAEEMAHTRQQITVTYKILES